MNSKQRALDYLRTALDNSQASFRDGQWESIESLLNQKRVLVVQRTGWGKSMVYFLATKLFREQGAGPTLLISPLLSLMRNQIEAAQRIGVAARTINSTNNDEWLEIKGQLASNQVDILVISPERLANDEFRQTILSKIAGNIGLFVIDEAHCLWCIIISRLVGLAELLTKLLGFYFVVKKMISLLIILFAMLFHLNSTFRKFWLCWINQMVVFLYRPCRAS